MIVKYSLDRTASKRVSFIMATRNRDKFLGENLPKIKPLVKRNDEVIVIDGASTDKTLSVLRKYPDFIDIIISEKDINPTHAANKGILLSKGKYIKFLSDDDIIYPTAMENAIQVMEKHTEIDVLVCGGTWSRLGEASIKINYAPPGVNYGSKTDNIFRYGACGQGFIIRRSALPQIGIFDTDDWFSDMSFIIKAIKKGACIKFCRINLYHAYAHSDTTGNKHKIQVEHSKLKLIKENADLNYRTRYVFNQFIDKNTVLKFIFNSIFRIINKFRKEDKVTEYKNIWDGGLS